MMRHLRKAKKTLDTQKTVVGYFDPLALCLDLLITYLLKAPKTATKLRKN